MNVLGLIFKVVLLGLSGKSFAIAFLPPNPPTQKKLRVNFFEVYTPYIVITLTSIFWAIMSLDALATALNSGLQVVSASSTDVVGAYICPSRTSNKAGDFRDLSTSLALLFQAALLTISAVGRLWCYRTLGKQFRFEVSLQDKHRLVTSGPYAFVRHPSYLMLYGSYIGSVGMMLAKGAWMRECFLQTFGETFMRVIGGEQRLGALLNHSAMDYAMFSLFSAWVVAIIYCERSLVARSLSEDEVLKNEFGKEWIEYARRVPWRFLPFVY
ncbi:hypothetical protein SCHPADRAFT_900350 [Schizopora paradoxa]|uniref:Protein-S-isoprenylcysteine O-methyltransferase n=1 Tax=Schizopora paradoxa TaxID=27342 RepID=A0A0H2S1Q5_9AGAM|nr:hypothetical protein SCHPADRAFT_900350 [Schizopora paradoxa]